MHTNLVSKLYASNLYAYWAFQYGRPMHQHNYGYPARNMLTMGYQHADYEYQQQAGYSPNWMPGYNANPVCLPGYLSSYAQSAYQARKAQHAYK